MSITIQVPEGEEALTDFLSFRDQVYLDRPVRWPTIVPMQLPMLLGKGPFAEGRMFRPLLALDDGHPVARALAVVDDRYNAHWHERLGHLNLFEALAGAREATRVMADAACSWLREHGVNGARAGFHLGELPFVTDDYDSLPPIILRHNPAYYHALLKDAGFETEKGLVDYKIEVTPDLVGKWEASVEGARRAGYEITPLRDVPQGRRLPDFTDTWNDAFSAHWGATPLSEGEFGDFFALLGPFGMLDTSVIAYRDGAPVGVLWVAPEAASLGALATGRPLREDEKLNFLGIGVRSSDRGRGVNMAMASYSFLELVRRGATWVSYTLVLDDNWPSRRTGEKLGGFVCANYVVYRRSFGR